MAYADVEETHPLHFGESIQSFQLSKIFITTPTYLSLATSIEPTELRAAVRRIQDYVNANGGFSVSGWYKCGTNQENVVNRISEFHFVSIKPMCNMPQKLKLSLVNRLAVGCNNNGDDAAAAYSLLLRV